MKQEPRLKFTDQELAENTPVGKKARKAAKAAEKADRAEAKIPKRRKPKAELKFEEDTPKPSAGTASKGNRTPSKKKLPKGKLSFEEEIKKPPARKRSVPQAVSKDALQSVFQNQAGDQPQEQDESVSLEAAQAAADAGHQGMTTLREARQAARLRPYRNAEKAEKKLEQANLHYLHAKAQAQTPVSNPFSRWQQKQRIKRQYAAAKRAQDMGRTVSGASKAADTAVEGVRKIGQSVKRHSKAILVVLALFLLLCFFLNVLSSCSVILEGIGSAVTAGTYPAGDDALLGAESAYTAKEQALKKYLDSYESTHNYDEYHFELAEIRHDPYVLASLLSAKNPGNWSAAEMTGILEEVFQQQYVLAEDVQTEIRYKPETKVGIRYVYNEETQCFVPETYTYTEEVPYEYTVCTVRLENRQLDRLPVELLTESQLAMYATYMATLGNRPELWPESPYVDLYTNKQGQSYSVPEIADEKAAAMIREAQKYIGYPYVWGGSSPSTSFDCSGFVCWAANAAGYHVGRTSAQGLCNFCTPISASIARPGDLVFFKGTYDTPGVSHCGIYLGNNMMIHCGDPIKYSNINTSYWQSHFYTFGRLP